MLEVRRKTLSGKRTGGTEINSATSREVKGGTKLLYAVDSHDETRWLIDGGAVYSIIPPTPQQKAAGPNAWQLEAANGSSIPCYGVTD